MDYDTDVGSDYEVISDDNKSPDASYDNPILRALKKPLYSSSDSGSSSGSSTGSTIATVLNSMSSVVPSMEEEVSSRTYSSEDNGSMQKRMVTPEPSLDYIFSSPLNVMDEESDHNAPYSDDECDEIFATQEETKAVLKAAIQKVGEFKEEKETMLGRITQLEKNVERLNAKNKTLQKINENGTIFERHRREKEAQNQQTGESDGGQDDALKAGKKKSSSCIEILLMLSIITVGICVIGAVAFQAWSADDRMERLHDMIAVERRHTEKLRAELDFLEQRLNASFEHIEKMERLLNSPLQRDFFRTMDAAETKLARGCFIHLNSTENVCRSLTDLLEREGYDNARLKEQLRLMRGMANFFMGVIFFLPVFFYYIQKRKN